MKGGIALADEKKVTGAEEPVTEEKTTEETPAEEAVEMPETAETAAEETAEEASGETAGETEEAENTEETSGEPEGAADKSEDGKAVKKSFFKKKEKKDKRDEQIADLTDRLQRQMAEFDNFRKRSEKEKASMYQIGAKDVIEKLLPVVDNFERGLAGADESDPFADGMSKIYKQLQTMLADLGVEPIECEGKEFDPNLHNAVMHVEDESVGENIIVQELQKGYTYKDSVVRHSMVKVAN